MKTTKTPAAAAPAAPTANKGGAKIIPLPGIAKVDQRRSDAKWTQAVIKLGYTPLPSLLLRAQGKLGLSPELFNTLLQIIEHWWEADKMPFPSKETLARRMGKSARQVQRYLTDLEQGGFIKRIERFNGVKAQTSNSYDMLGLVEKLKAIEPEFRKTVEQNKLRRKKVETPVSGGT